MNKPKVSINQINIIAKNYDATLGFYRMVGLDIPEPINQPDGALHAVSKSDQGMLLEVDNHYLANIYHAGTRKDGDSSSSTIIGIGLESRDIVDVTYCQTGRGGV